MKNILLVFFALFVAPVQAEFLLEGEPHYSSEFKEETSKLPDFHDLVPYLTRSVVNIAVEAEGDPDLDKKKKNPFFRDRPGEALGSGFVVSSDGYIVTNHHVVENAKKILVRFAEDKKDYEAKVKGFDKKTDLALLKVDANKKFEPLYLGNSDELNVGEWVLAVGNPFHLGQTVTAGIVSAKARKVNMKISLYDNFIQTDASINPGSSGGPLVNTAGQVVGINTAIMSPGRGIGGTGFNIGIGFAIPVNLAKKVINELHKYGSITRGLLGVIIQSVDEDIAQALGVNEPRGALVAEIMPNTPAAKSNFKVKDLIVEFNGVAIEEYSDLPLLVADTPVNSKVPVTVIRKGKKVTLYPRISKLSDSKFESVDELVIEQPDFLGLQVQDVTPFIAKSKRMKKARGVIVSSVEPESIAAQVGIDRGDVILEMHSKIINNEKDYKLALKFLPAGRPVLVLLVKKQGNRFLTFTIPADKAQK